MGLIRGTFEPLPCHFGELHRSFVVFLSIITSGRRFNQRLPKEYEAVENDEGNYAALRPFDVIVTRSGCATVMATSAREAMDLADEHLKFDDIVWDDDWHPVDAILREES